MVQHWKRRLGPEYRADPQDPKGTGTHHGTDRRQHRVSAAPQRASRDLVQAADRLIKQDTSDPRALYHGPFRRKQSGAHIPESNNMDQIWKDLHHAAMEVLKPREISRMIEAGGVAAAIESTSGHIYVGVCVDTACTLGVCAERNAMFQMITAGENEIRPCNYVGCQQERHFSLRRLPGIYDAADARYLPLRRDHDGLPE